MYKKLRKLKKFREEATRIDRRTRNRTGNLEIPKKYEKIRDIGTLALVAPKMLRDTEKVRQRS
eukprot:1016691-Amorphochlora_amoeboformis.AAC.1